MIRPDNLTELASVIDRYIQRAEGHPDLQTRGEELRQRIQEDGIGRFMEPKHG